MGDCKKIIATTKEPAVNVKNGAKTANSTLKEISTALKTVSVTPKDPLKCVKIDLKGFGETSVPDATLFKYNEDKSAISDFIRREIGKSVTELSSSIDTIYKSIGRDFIETSVASDTVSMLVNWVRNIVDNGYYYVKGYASDDYAEYQFKYIDILSVKLSRPFLDQSVATDTAFRIVSKVFAETSAASDTFSKTLQSITIETAIASDVLTAVANFNLSVQDWAYSTDDVLGNANVDDDQYMSMNKSILELMTYADALSSGLGKVFSDFGAATDIFSKSLNIALDESDYFLSDYAQVDYEAGALWLNDIASFNMGAQQNEEALSSDTLSYSIGFGRSFIESTDSADTLSVESSKVFSDSGIFVDNFSKSLNVALDESDYFLSDYAQVDYEAGALWLNDIASFNVSISRTELPVMSEMRIANLQSYMAQSYVDGGYIGTNYII
jgi:hypothetical protein